MARAIGLVAFLLGSSLGAQSVSIGVAVQNDWLPIQRTHGYVQDDEQYAPLGASAGVELGRRLRPFTLSLAGDLSIFPPIATVRLGSDMDQPRPVDPLTILATQARVSRPARGLRWTIGAGLLRVLETSREGRRNGALVTAGIRWGDPSRRRSYGLELQCVTGRVGRTDCVVPVRAHWR